MTQSINNSINFLENKIYGDSVFQGIGVSLAFFSTIGVDPVKKTVDIKMLQSGTTENSVSYLSPFSNVSSGYEFVPEINSIGVIASTNDNEHIIIGFLSSNLETDRSLSLREGEQMLKSSEMAVIKEDRSGNIFIATQSGSHIMLSKNGHFYINVENKVTNSLSTEQFSGRDENGNIFDNEFYYEEMPDINYNGIEDLVSKIFNGQAIENKKRYPLVEVWRINEFDENGNIVKMESTFDQSENTGFAYKIAINDTTTGKPLAMIGLDRDGTLILKGKKLIMDFEEVQSK